MQAECNVKIRWESYCIDVTEGIIDQYEPITVFLSLDSNQTSTC